MALGSGFASGVAINAIMSRWFVRRRARAMSVSSTGVSWGGVILAPLGAVLVERGGLALATPVLGALVLIVTLPIVLGVLVFDPRNVGLLPDGDKTEEEARAKTPQNSALGEATQRRRWTLKQAMSTLPFWAIIIAFSLVLMAQTGFVIHQIAFLEERLGSQSAAARALSITALGSIVARLAMGMVADQMDKCWLTAGVFVVQAVAVLLVLRVEGAWSTSFFILLFGMTIGNVYMLQSLLVSEIYGVVSFGAVFGIISMSGQMASDFGPFVIGLLDDRTGSYTTSFTITATATLIAAVVVLLARPLPPPPLTEETASA
ncbi:MAG: MFS transporter [Chloroflexi bacterium]|nr:MFS transporter [Chloroflexota bacterium]MDA1240170.1 MFS transporter [Chloroflexota bacterium]